jgi:hypothetical protein
VAQSQSSYLLRHVLVRVFRHWLQPSLSTNLRERVLERPEILDSCELIGDLLEKGGPFDHGVITGGRLDCLNAELALLLPPTVPARPDDVDTLVFSSIEHCVG